MILILLDQTRVDQRGPATVMAEIVEKRDQGTRGPETVMAEILILVDQTRVDQTGLDQTRP